MKTVLAIVCGLALAFVIRIGFAASPTKSDAQMARPPSLSAVPMQNSYDVKVNSNVPISLLPVSGGTQITVIGIGDLLRIQNDNNGQWMIAAVAKVDGTEYRYPQIPWDGSVKSLLFVEDQIFSEFGPLEIRVERSGESHLLGTVRRM